MTETQRLINVYRQQAQMVHAHVADFSEGDMLVRPFDKANHAAWQLGHLTSMSIVLANTAVPGALPEPPAEFVQRHGPDGVRLNEGFEPKAQLLRRFDEMNEAAIAWVGTLTEADRAKPTPESIHRFAVTIGHLAMMLPIHAVMHLGQIQVIRRKLGKPVLF